MKQQQYEQLRSCFVRSVTEGNVSLSEAELKQWQQQLEIDLCDTDSFCMVLKFSDATPKEQYCKTLIDLKKLSLKILQEENRRCYAVIGHGMDVVLALNNYSEFARSDFQAVADKLSRRMRNRIRIGIGRPYSNLMQLHNSTEEAYEALEWGGGQIQVADIQDKHAGRAVSSAEIRNNYRKTMGDFQNGSMEDLRSDLTMLAEQVRAGTVLHKDAPYPSSIRRTMIEVMVEMLHIAADMGVDVDKQIGYVDPYRKIFELKATPDIIEWVVEKAQVLQDAMSARRERMEATQLEQAKEFIHTHLSDIELGLAPVSAHVGMSPSYFSAFFIREAGIGFKEYVTAERIRLAQKLLRETGNSINSISERCGFLTPSYFISVFKSQTGMTPGAYRKRKS